eukprot:3211403-Amphidinium_carterae.1
MDSITKWQRPFLKLKNPPQKVCCTCFRSSYTHLGPELIGQREALECMIGFVRRYVPCFYDGASLLVLHVSLLFFRPMQLGSRIINNHQRPPTRTNMTIAKDTLAT